MASESLIGNLAVLLTMETAAFEKGASHASKLLRKTQRQFEDMAVKMVGIGQKMSIGLTAPLVGFGAVAIKEATEASAAMAQVNAALTSMGPVAGRTAKQLKSAADALEMKSLFEGDEILRKVTANLLTFGNISGKAFDQAQQAAIDLSARLGTDLQSSALLVGKALNDPIKGMATLGRAGIQFSESQREAIKAMVETGNVAGAQAVILGEFQRQFGGAAQAAQDADPFNKANDAFKQMAETVGNALLPIIPGFTSAVVAVANAFSNLSPGTQKFLIIAGGLAAVFGPLLVVFGTMVSAIGSLLPLIIGLAAPFTAAGAAGGAAAVGTTALGLALRGILMLLGPVGLAVGAVVLAYQNWDKIKPYVDKANAWMDAYAADVAKNVESLKGSINSGASAWQSYADRVAANAAGLKATISGLATSVVQSMQRLVVGVTAWIQKLSAPFDWVRNKAQEVGDAFFKLYDRVVGHSYIPDMVEGIRNEMAKLDAVMVQPVVNATDKAASAFRSLRERVHGLLTELFPKQAQELQFNKDLRDLTAYAEKAKWSVEQLAEATRKLELARGISTEDTAALPEVSGESTILPNIPVQTEKMQALINIANQANDAMKNVAMDGVRSLADGLTAVIGGTAKLGDVFRSVALGIIQDLLRIQIQKMLMSIGTSIGIPGLSGARAAGGPVSRGGLYLVGERGPELFAPGSSGKIIPNHEIGGGGSFTFNNYARMSADEARRTGMQAAAGYRAEMARATRKGM